MEILLRIWMPGFFIVFLISMFVLLMGSFFSDIKWHWVDRVFLLLVSLACTTFFTIRFAQESLLNTYGDFFSIVAISSLCMVPFLFGIGYGQFTARRLNLKSIIGRFGLHICGILIIIGAFPAFMGTLSWLAFIVRHINILIFSGPEIARQSWCNLNKEKLWNITFMLLGYVLIVPAVLIERKCRAIRVESKKALMDRIREKHEKKVAKE